MYIYNVKIKWHYLNNHNSENMFFSLIILIFCRAHFLDHPKFLQSDDMICAISNLHLVSFFILRLLFLGALIHHSWTSWLCHPSHTLFTTKNIPRFHQLFWVFITNLQGKFLIMILACYEMVMTFEWFFWILRKKNMFSQIF